MRQNCRLPVGGTGTSIATGQGNPSAIAVDGTYVYWVTLTAIMRVPIGGGTVKQLAADTAYQITTDATAIYWSSTAAGGSIVKLAK